MFQYLRDKEKERKKGAQKKGAENSSISPPLDPRLGTVRAEACRVSSDHKKRRGKTVLQQTCNGRDQRRTRTRMRDGNASK